MPELLKALSVRQSHAEQIMRGLKAIDYRGSATKIRGRVYTYASNQSDDDNYEFGEELDVSLKQLQRGVVVGTIEMVYCTDERRKLRSRS